MLEKISPFSSSIFKEMSLRDKWHIRGAIENKEGVPII